MMRPFPPSLPAVDSTGQPTRLDPRRDGQRPGLGALVDRVNLRVANHARVHDVGLPLSQFRKAIWSTLFAASR